MQRKKSKMKSFVWLLDLVDAQFSGNVCVVIFFFLCQTNKQAHHIFAMQSPVLLVCFPSNKLFNSKSTYSHYLPKNICFIFCTMFPFP
jgi:hypothetical protein